jgi:rod shape-determining protein MreD
MKMNEVLTYVLRFVIFVLIQALILNHMNISGYLNPLLYVMFILLLPFDMSRPLTLVLAFVLGYAVDLFSGTPGMHAAASVLLAFVRPFLIDALSKREDDDADMKPTLRSMGFRWIFSYTAILVLIHHTVFFFIEAFRLTEFWQTLSRSLLSSAMTIVLIILIQFVFFSGRGSKKKFSS